MKCETCGRRIQWHRVGRVLDRAPDGRTSYALVEVDLRDDSERTVAVVVNDAEGRQVSERCLEHAETGR